MLSVLAFKRSLSTGILDGGSGEVSLGGSRLNRFMKEVESVTGHMGVVEPVMPVEELMAAPPATSLGVAPNLEATEAVAGNAPEETGGAVGDPWQALAEVGAQLVSALATANDPAVPAHPWIERDPATGARSLKVPLPPPEVTSRIADAFSSLADLLRRR
jgi:hypothetical protein